MEEVRVSSCRNDSSLFGVRRRLGTLSALLSFALLLGGVIRADDNALVPTSKGDLLTEIEKLQKALLTKAKLGDEAEERGAALSSAYLLKIGKTEQDNEELDAVLRNAILMEHVTDRTMPYIAGVASSAFVQTQLLLPIPTYVSSRQFFVFVDFNAYVDGTEIPDFRSGRETRSQLLRTERTELPIDHLSKGQHEIKVRGRVRFFKYRSETPDHEWLIWLPSRKFKVVDGDLKKLVEVKLSTSDLKTLKESLTVSINVDDVDCPNIRQLYAFFEFPETSVPIGGRVSIKHIGSEWEGEARFLRDGSAGSEFIPFEFSPMDLKGEGGVMHFRIRLRPDRVGAYKNDVSKISGCNAIWEDVKAAIKGDTASRSECRPDAIGKP